MLVPNHGASSGIGTSGVWRSPGQQGSGVEKAKVGGPEMATRYCQALKDEIFLTVLENVKFHGEG